jgi:hypothetical protein
MALLYGRAGRLTAQTGGFRPGQWRNMITELGLSEEALAARGLCRAHPDFMAIAIGLPVPPFPGRPLDPPLRSRFQGIASGPLGPASLFDALSSTAPDASGASMAVGGEIITCPSTLNVPNYTYDQSCY